MPQPLAGVRVIEIGQEIQGPFAGPFQELDGHRVIAREGVEVRRLLELVDGSGV